VTRSKRPRGWRIHSNTSPLQTRFDPSIVPQDRRERILKLLVGGPDSGDALRAPTGLAEAAQTPTEREGGELPPAA
jgi:hypothetical protein